MSEFSGVLSETGKVSVLKAATLLAASDGELHETELQLIGDIAHSLGVPSAYVPEIMRETLAAETSSIADGETGRELPEESPERLAPPENRA